MRTLLKDSSDFTDRTVQHWKMQNCSLGMRRCPHGLNVNTNAWLSEVTHWSLLASIFVRSEGDVHNWLILSRGMVEKSGSSWASQNSINGVSIVELISF